ncbi:conserved hypothetical protein [Ahrensia sp. R2A130]|nr:conserved hypothetical protein [Ahrensia sp. R2A130]
MQDVRPHHKRLEGGPGKMTATRLAIGITKQRVHAFGPVLLAAS